MNESFDPVEYLEHLSKRWRFVAAAVFAAAAVALVLCLVLPKQYTATAALMIDPPGGDQRTSIAVSPIYLESLKSYETFASSDTLFVAACEKFNLLTGGSSSIEALKRRILRVDKLKDTKVLQISITLPDAGRAQAVTQYLAEQTVALNHSMVRAGDHEMLGDLQQQWEQARKDVDRARTDAAAVAAGGSEPVLESEAASLSELRSRAEAQRIEANAVLAENAAKGDPEFGASAQARLTTLTAEVASLQRQIDAKSATLARLRARRQDTDDRLRRAEDILDSIRRRKDDTADATRFRTEQLRIIDPGIVPQRPSFPNVPIAIASAIGIALVMCLVWLTLQFGFARHRELPARTGLRVAGSGSR